MSISAILSRSIILSLFILFLMPVLVRQNESIVSASKEADLEAEIKMLEQKWENAQKQGEGLAKEINIIESNIALKNIQIKQADYQIEQKEDELDLLKEDIGLLEIRLDRLDETIGYHENLLSQRIKRQYINNQLSIFEMLISSNDIGDFMARIKYMQKVEAEDRELLKKMNSTKSNYEVQQNLLKEKKDQVEEIKKQIEGQKAQAQELRASLEQQKQAKDNLLRVTQNNEKKYKELLEDARKELAQIQAAANIVIRTGTAEKVKKGEVIGTMGNSGFSTGAHLHFGVYNYSIKDFQSTVKWDWYYSNYKNPFDYIKKSKVLWDTSCGRDPSRGNGYAESGRGDWDWPIDVPVRITQNFGSNTCWNFKYGGKPHPALDMVGIDDISVKAIADGEAYFCRDCLGDGGNGVFIFHEDDKMSIYWHLR